MKLLHMLLSALLALGLSGSVSASAEQGGIDVALDAVSSCVPQDPIDQVPTCEALCAALENAQDAYDAAVLATIDAISEWQSATLNQESAQQQYSAAVAELSNLQDAADEACANGTPAECQAALLAINTQQGVVADARDSLALAKIATEAAVANLAQADAEEAAALEARDAAQAAADAAGCECGG